MRFGKDRGLKCPNCGRKDWRFLRFMKNTKTDTIIAFYCTHCQLLIGKHCDFSIKSWTNADGNKLKLKKRKK